MVNSFLLISSLGQIRLRLRNIIKQLAARSAPTQASISFSRLFRRGTLRPARISNSALLEMPLSFSATASGASFRRGQDLHLPFIAPRITYSV
jgi:hypothetical protein